MFYFEWAYTPWQDVNNSQPITEENVTSIEETYLKESGIMRAHIGVFTLSVRSVFTYKDGSTKWKVSLACDVTESDCAGTLLHARGSLHDAIKASEKLMLSKPLPETLLW